MFVAASNTKGGSHGFADTDGRGFGAAAAVVDAAAALREIGGTEAVGGALGAIAGDEDVSAASLGGAEGTLEIGVMTGCVGASRGRIHKK